MIEKLENVTAIAKANVYFDGNVSHTIYTADGDRKTLGLFLSPVTMNLGQATQRSWISSMVYVRYAS